MALFVWNDSYSVKVAVIDQQHQKLFNMLNQLHEALGAGQGHAAVKKILQALVDYTGTHFRNEEGMLEKQGYPNLASHRLQHKALIDQVKKLQSDYESGQMGTAIKLMNLLQEWLKNHIMKTDLQYSSCLNQKVIH